VPDIPHLSAEQHREASADAGPDERHDEDNRDELGVHHYNRPQILFVWMSNVTTKDTFVPTPVAPAQMVLSPCFT
jgi:hypothetical protein